MVVYGLALWKCWVQVSQVKTYKQSVYDAGDYPVTTHMVIRGSGYDFDHDRVAYKHIGIRVFRAFCPPVSGTQEIGFRCKR